MQESWQSKYQAYALAASPVAGLYLNIAHQHGRYSFLQIPFSLTDVTKIDVLSAIVTGLSLWLYVAVWAVLLFLPVIRRRAAVVIHILVNTALVTLFVTGLNPQLGATAFSVFITYALIGAATMLSYGAGIFVDGADELSKDQSVPKRVIPVAYLNITVFVVLFSGFLSFSLGYFSEKKTVKRIYSPSFPNHIVVDVDASRLVLKPYDPKEAKFSPGTVRIITPLPTDLTLEQKQLWLQQR